MLSLQWIVFVKFITKSDKGTLTAPSPRHWVRLGQPLVVILRKTWAAPLNFKSEERLLRAAFKKKKKCSADIFLIFKTTEVIFERRSTILDPSFFVYDLSAFSSETERCQKKPKRANVKLHKLGEKNVVIVGQLLPYLDNLMLFVCNCCNW